MMSLERKNDLNETFQMAIEGCKKFVNGQHQSSMITIYKAGTDSTIKHWGKYK